jgi:hypothetical protein
MWLVIFLLTGGKPTRVMTSDMLGGPTSNSCFDHVGAARQDRRARLRSGGGKPQCEGLLAPGSWVGGQ